MLPQAAHSSHTPVDPAPRVLAVDAMRGLVILLMFLVNSAGNDPAFPSWFPHRGWNNGAMGLGLADLVFPWFLFVVGVSVPLSMRSGRGARRSTLSRLALAFRRATIIYLLGTLLWCATIAYNPQTPLTWRVFLHWDILPLIALGYLTTVILELLSRWSHLPFVAIVLTLKWTSLTLAPHPDTNTVLWEQSRSFDHVVKTSLGWFGVLLTQGLPAAALCSLGALTSHALFQPASPPRRPAHVLIAGLLLAFLGLLWHRSGNMPLSKDFLTSSYVLFSAGTAAATLAALWWVIDLRQFTRATPLRVVGMNAIALYLLAELLWKMALVRWHVVTPDAGVSSAFVAAKAWLQHALGPLPGSWAVVLFYIALYWSLALALYRRSVFIRI